MIILLIPWWGDSSIAIVSCIVTVIVEAPTITSLSIMINMINAGEYDDDDDDDGDDDSNDRHYKSPPHDPST